MIGSYYIVLTSCTRKWVSGTPPSGNHSYMPLRDFNIFLLRRVGELLRTLQFRRLQYFLLQSYRLGM